MAEQTEVRAPKNKGEQDAIISGIAEFAMLPMLPRSGIETDVSMAAALAQLAERDTIPSHPRADERERIGALRRREEIRVSKRQ